MSDWINEIVKIEKIEKHPNADNLSVASVMNDYPVVIRTGSYNVGDLVGYLSLESIVPDTEQFHFLSPKQYEKYEENGEVKQRMIGPKYPIGSVPEKYRRLKAKKFFGIYSQGMLIDCPSGMKEGDSLVEFFGLKKFEEEEEDNIPNAKKSKGANAAPAPKGWSIPHYDIEGLRKYIACLQPNEEIVFTEKVHGSNASFCHDGEKLWVKSRNYYKKMDPDDPWWDIAIRYGLEEKLSKFPGMVFFGEMYGQVKGFRYDCELVDGKMNSKIRFFDIYNTKTMRYVDYDPFVTMVTDVGLEVMPLLYRGIWTSKEDMYPYAEGLTTLGGKHIREGFVLRTAVERFEPRLNSRMIVKLVGEAYNLQK